MSKHRHQRTEQDNHRKAFETYYALGEKRSYRQVAQQLGVSLPTIKLWAGSFNWQRRILERDAEVGRRIADRALQSTVEERERNRKIIHLALMKVAKAIAEGRVKAQISDLDRLVRLQAFLDGQAEMPGASESIADGLAGVDIGILRQTIEILKEHTRKLREGKMSEWPDAHGNHAV